MLEAASRKNCGWLQMIKNKWNLNEACSVLYCAECLSCKETTALNVSSWTNPNLPSYTAELQTDPSLLIKNEIGWNKYRNHI